MADPLLQLADAIASLILANLASFGAVEVGEAWTLGGQRLTVVRQYLPVVDLDKLVGVQVTVLPWGDHLRKPAILANESHDDVRVVVQMKVPPPTTVGGVTNDPTNDPTIWDPVMEFTSALAAFLLQAQPQNTVCLGTERDPAYLPDALHHLREWHAEIKTMWKSLA
jgi:hypothetical protein